MLFHPGEDGFGQRSAGPFFGERFKRGERDLRFLAFLADQAHGDLVDLGAGVAEQTFVDVADLLDVDVAERDPPGRLSLELGDLDGVEDFQHHPVADGDGEGAAFVASGQEREPARVEQ